MSNSSASEAYVAQRGTHVALAVAANLGRLSRTGSAQFVGHSSEPGAAVVIGGGPSCGGFDRIPPGVLTICVNTSAPKVCAEIAPDALVIREIVPAVRELSALKHAPRTIVLDICVAPVTAARAMEVAPVLWAIPGQALLGFVKRLLDQEPVYGGESAMNMAVSLATRWGCDRQSLIGCDLALGLDGTAYGDGTAWSGCKATAKDGSVDFGTTRYVMQANARGAGVPAAFTREQTTPVLREDGTPGLALSTWVSQRAWVEQWARRHPGHVFANLSGGAKIDGWPASATVLTGPPRHDVPRVTVDTGAIEREVCRQIRAAREAATDRAPWRSPDALDGWPLIDFAAAKEVLETSYRNLPIKLALAERGPIMLRAADAVERAFAG